MFECMYACRYICTAGFLVKNTIPIQLRNASHMQTTCILSDI